MTLGYVVAVRRRAPWLRTAEDAVYLMDPHIAERFRLCEVRPYTSASLGR